jgi:membrane protease YdiL (CAAX protease family)
MQVISLARPVRPLKSLGLFICLGVVAYGFGWAGAIFFPGQRPGAVVARAALASIGVALLLFGSSQLLRRAAFPPDALGLRPTWHHARGFVLGTAAGSLLYAALAATLAVQVPFHWERGLLSFSDAVLAAHTYFWTAWGEELLFRGYALLVLMQYLGPRRAVWVMALAFGLFHLPGMEGLAAVRMVATTGIMAVVFSFSFLLTRTLWTAIGLHVAVNVWLHTLTGLDASGQATSWNMVMTKPWPTNYNAAFWSFFMVTSLVAFLCFWQWNLAASRSAASSHPLETSNIGPRMGNQ